jgi:hypothetical protein
MKSAEELAADEADYPIRYEPKLCMVATLGGGYVAIEAWRKERLAREFTTRERDAAIAKLEELRASLGLTKEDQ